MDDFFLKENILWIKNKKIVLKYPIKLVKKIAGKYVVLLQIPHIKLGKEELNNIICYDGNGIKCWRISDKLPIEIKSKEQIPYVAIQLLDDKLYTTDFWGRKFEVDIGTGKLKNVEIVH